MYSENINPEYPSPERSEQTQRSEIYVFQPKLFPNRKPSHDTANVASTLAVTPVQKELVAHTPRYQLITDPSRCPPALPASTKIGVRASSPCARASSPSSPPSLPAPLAPRFPYRSRCHILSRCRYRRANHCYRGWDKAQRLVSSARLRWRRVR